MPWFWLQLVIFQVLWLTAVMDGNLLLPVCIFLLALHFILTPNRRRDAKLWPLALLGLAIDGVLTLANAFGFDVVPFWLGALWIAFALTLSHGLAWLKKIPFQLQAAIAAICAAASYQAGWKLQAAELPLGLLISALVLAAVWSVLLPVMVKFETKIGSAT